MRGITLTWGLRTPVCTFPTGSNRCSLMTETHILGLYTHLRFWVAKRGFWLSYWQVVIIATATVVMIVDGGCVVRGLLLAVPLRGAAGSALRRWTQTLPPLTLVGLLRRSPRPSSWGWPIAKSPTPTHGPYTWYSVLSGRPSRSNVVQNGHCKHTCSSVARRHDYFNAKRQETREIGETGDI